MIAICGGCAVDGEVSRLTSRLDEGAAAHCHRCGAKTYLVLGPAPNLCCSHEEHAAMKVSVELFRASTVNHQTYLGTLSAQCAEPGCDSTISLPLCSLSCGEPCPSSNAISWGPTEDDVAHVECVMRVMLTTATTRFVIVHGGGKAHELRVDGVSGGGAS